jgi:hypothetical protein
MHPRLLLSTSSVPLQYDFGALLESVTQRLVGGLNPRFPRQLRCVGLVLVHHRLPRTSSSAQSNPTHLHPPAPRACPRRTPPLSPHPTTTPPTPTHPCSLPGPRAHQAQLRAQMATYSGRASTGRAEGLLPQGAEGLHPRRIHAQTDTCQQWAAQRGLHSAMSGGSRLPISGGIPTGDANPRRDGACTKALRLEGVRPGHGGLR